MILLSIIYCTARKETNFDKIKSMLPVWCEIVVNKNNGEKPLGYYRNECVKKAKGKYISVIDDDDDITNDYFDEIKKGIDSNVDLVSVYEDIYENDICLGYAVSGFNNPYHKGSMLLRGVGHRDAVKRQKVIDCGNYNINVSREEDAELSIRLIKELKTAYYVNHAIYRYNKVRAKKLYDKHQKATINSFAIEDYYV